MTIVVSVKVNDGIVLAADSAASFFDGGGHAVKIYRNANKIFNLVKVWPIGAMVYGAGGIGSASIESLSKDLRSRLSDSGDAEYGLGKSSYTVEEVATKARKWLFEEHFKKAYSTPPPGYFLGYRVCGYSAGASLAEAWEFTISGDTCDPPTLLMRPDEFGIRWAGENEALDRLLLGVSSQIEPVLTAEGYDAAAVSRVYLDMVRVASATVAIPAMPIKDAIDLARFAVETSAKFARFGLRPETIGGPAELAAITTHEGFKWIARKHYYDAALNRETDHV